MKRSFVWGLDCAGSLTATAGVGALLMIQTADNAYFPAFDGNGNVAGLLDQNGSAAAKYEYNPYGELTRVEGPCAHENPFRWSTKYTDTETGLVYYGLRYYSPRTGRFINRDPIGEQGGLNLYGFVNNNPVGKIDILGLRECATFTIWKQKTYFKGGKLIVNAWKENYMICNNSGGTYINFGSADGGGGNASAGANSDSNNDPKPKGNDKWEPNKKDCDNLKNEYPDLFKKAGESFKDPVSAGMAAQMQSAADTRSNNHEYTNAMYGISDGTYAYSSSVKSASTGGASYIGNVTAKEYYSLPDNAVTVFAVTHSHDIGFSAWRTIARGYGSPTQADYLNAARSFSGADIDHTRSWALMLHNPQNEIRILKPEDAKAAREANLSSIPGKTFSNMPPETVNKIIDCIAKGF